MQKRRKIGRGRRGQKEENERGEEERREEEEKEEKEENQTPKLDTYVLSASHVLLSRPESSDKMEKMVRSI